MSDFEKPGSYYIGKAVDPNTGEPTDEYILYDARDLTTHAVCVGMTGSGKTGLCIDILEEAALNGVPTIMIDPKGDITNLLLTFPELRPEDFLPWVNPDDARRKGLSLEEFAQKTAQTWRDGLAQWGQGPERIQRLKDAAEFTIFTPGSDAGQPVSILQTLKAPQLPWDTEQETLRKLSTTVSSAARKRGLTAKAQAEVEESKQAIAQMEKEKEQLQNELQAELDALRKAWDEAVEQISQVEISPNKTDIVVQMFGIGWRPVWEIGYDDGQGREVRARVPAFGGAP